MNFNLTLPLPPSTNKRLLCFRGRFILSSEARQWLEEAHLIVWVFCKNNKITPIGVYFHLDLAFFVPRSNSDSHNYLKLLMDALEQGGLVVNDKFIMPRIQNVKIDNKRPRVEMCWLV